MLINNFGICKQHGNRARRTDDHNLSDACKYHFRNVTLRDHRLSTYAAFREKVIFLPTDTDTLVSGPIFLNHHKSICVHRKFLLLQYGIWL